MADTTHLVYRAGMHSEKSRKLKRNHKIKMDWRCEECQELCDSFKLHAHHSSVSASEIMNEALKRSGLTVQDLRLQYDKEDPRHQAFRKACDDIHLNGLNGIPVIFEVLCVKCHNKRHLRRVVN